MNSALKKVGSFKESICIDGLKVAGLRILRKWWNLMVMVSQFITPMLHCDMLISSCVSLAHAVIQHLRALGGDVLPDGLVFSSLCVSPRRVVQSLITSEIVLHSELFD